MGGVAKAVSGAIEAVGKVLSSAVELIPKVVVGAATNVYHTLHGALTGNFEEFKTGLIGGLKTTMAVMSIVYGGPWGIAAGITVLDAQYNDSKMLRATVHGLGEIETALLGSRFIAQNEEYIVLAGNIIASMVAASNAWTYITDPNLGYIPSDITNLLKDYGSYLNVAQSGYGIYQTYQQIQNIREYYENLIQDLLAQFEFYSKALAARSELWFNLYTDYDMIGRIMAGGDLYNGGAGSPYYTVTDAHEPSYLMLASETKRISDIDGIFNNQNDSLMAGGRDFMHSLGSGIKYN